MKNLLMAAFVAVFSFASHSANAQEYAGQRYVGISIGQTKNDFCDFIRYVVAENSDFDFTFTRTCPDKDTGIKLYVGHNLHKNFAVEAGSIDFGEFKSTYGHNLHATVDIGDRYSAGDVLASGFHSAKTSGNSFFVAGIWKIHVHPKATLFGKVGLHRWDIESKICSDYSSVGVRRSPPTDCVGGEVVPFSNNIKLRMEYEMFPTKAFGPPSDSRFDDAFDFESFSIGITYAF